MRCKKCNVEISCKTEVCPLCHERLDKNRENIKEIKKMERAFPKRLANRPLVVTPFNKVYLIIALNIAIISIAANAIFTPEFYWSLVVIGFLFYIYFFIRYTILSYSHLNRKIFSQAIALFAIFVLIQRVFDENLWIYQYVLPFIVFISILMIGIYIIVNLQVARKYIVSLFLLAVIGLAPLVIILIIGNEIIWPSIVVALTSGSIILTTIIIARKTLWAEIKRVFHL